MSRLGKKQASRLGKKIILRPVRADDFEGELDGLVEALHEALPDVGVEVWDPLQGPPGSSLPAFSEILTVILPFAGGYAFDAAADLIVGRLRSAMSADEKKMPERVVELYGPSGEVLKRVRLPDEGYRSTPD
jgi:hypothetical protein